MPSLESFKLIEWNSSLDLENFYKEALNRGFDNNSSQANLVDVFSKEKQKQVWILYYNNEPVGSVASHSLDILESNSYRICARTCVFTNKIPIVNIINRKITIQQHQNITAQLFIPKCIEWAGINNNLYISTNESNVASQRQVHRIYCPSLLETGAITDSVNIFYRGHMQTFWKLNPKVFLKQLYEYGKW